MVLKGYEPVGLYRWCESFTAPDTTTFTRAGPAVRHDQIVELTHLSINDYTTVNMKCSIGIRHEGEADHYLRTKKAAQWWGSMMRGTLYLLPGDAPFGEVATPTANDVVYFSAHGIVYEKVGGE